MHVQFLPMSAVGEPYIVDIIINNTWGQ